MRSLRLRPVRGAELIAESTVRSAAVKGAKIGVASPWRKGLGGSMAWPSPSSTVTTCSRHSAAPVCGRQESRTRVPTCQVPWDLGFGGSRLVVEEDRPPSGEGHVSRPIRQMAGARLQEDFPERTLHRFVEVCRNATPNVARARECPPAPECVPVSYPQGCKGTPTKATLHDNLQGFYIEAL